MSRRPASFSQTDVTRVVRGIQAAGLASWRLEILPNGVIVVEPAAPEARQIPDVAEADHEIVL